jgi:CheY-like chemotaxis protein
MHVMVVDDEADIVRLNSIIFEIHNHKTTKASSGGECLKKLDEGARPDVILLDVMMPGINGLDTCKRIKADERFKHIPVVILSAKTESAEVEKGIQAGAADYLIKPIDPYELLKKVENYASVARASVKK